MATPTAPKSTCDEFGTKIAVIGSGLIGRNWSMLFAAAGFNVYIYDIEPQQVDGALKTILVQLKELESSGLLRGTTSAEHQHSLIHGSHDIGECVKGAFYVQECVPEVVDLKKTVFEKLDGVVSPTTILASSTSALKPSSFTEFLKNRSQCVVAHPVNPPVLIPLVEIVPAPWTNPSVIETTRCLMEKIGQSPVTLKREVLGFALNRIQYALIHECWRLVEDDVISVEDIDKVMTDGLGLRYAFIGPLETCHLNANGMVDYCNRYGANLYKVGQEFGPAPKMEGPAMERIANELCRQTPVEDVEKRRCWRDVRITALAKLKQELGSS